MPATALAAAADPDGGLKLAKPPEVPPLEDRGELLPGARLLGPLRGAMPLLLAAATSAISAATVSMLASVTASIAACVPSKGS